MSDYLKKLELEAPGVAVRYKQKIAVINNIDPFCLEESDTSVHPDTFPPVSSIDLTTYLVLTTSYYTKEQMKAFKSLSAYKYFEAGFVSSCRAKVIREKTIVIGKVKHSQKMNSPPLNTWILCSNDGSVETAHCTCMAGTGEVCSHVGALLYAVEFISTRRQNTSCTDVRAMWKVPVVSKVDFKPIAQINFGKTISGSKIKSDEIPPMDKSDINEMLNDLKEAGSTPALMLVTEPFASEIMQNIEQETVDNIYTSLYKQQYEASSYENLLSISRDFKYEISDETCCKIMEITKKQALSEEWFKHRTGRITASKLKQVCNTPLDKPSLSLIKQICYPTQVQFRTKATEWGKTHETIALQRYQTQVSQTHNDLDIVRVGLCIKPEYLQLGASPDALVRCSCCGVGPVEIKCPYNFRNTSLLEYSKLQSSCLDIENDNEVQLNRNHAYYYQCQAQMALTDSVYCDFVLWSPKENFVERIYFNEDFWCAKLSLALEFHKKVIMPELLGRFYTKTAFPVPVTYCKCQRPDDGRPMLQCCNDACSIQWYHMDCVGLSEVPTSSWYCILCKK